MTVVSQSDRITDMRRRFDDVEDFICWGEIAEAYFDRSASWFYHKLNGHDGNGRLHPIGSRTAARRLLGLGRTAAQNGGATRILSACAAVHTNSPSCLWTRGGIEVWGGGRVKKKRIYRNAAALNNWVVKC